MPTTALVLVPYAILILPQALIFGNESTPFIIGVMLLALLGALLGDLVFGVRRGGSKKPSPRYGPGLFLVARIILALGSASVALSAFHGAGTIFAQIGAAEGGSPLATVLAAFRSWLPAGFGLILASRMRQLCSARNMYVWLAVGLAAQAFAVTRTAITARFFVELIALVMVMLYLRLLRWHQAVAVAVAILILWPTLYTLRNEARLAGGVAVSSNMGAYDRLRYDLQIARADGLGTRVEIDSPGPGDIVRYGVLPRFLDPDRPTLSTGNAINVYLGGTRTSSFTFLPVTTLYVLEGPYAVVLFYFGWGIILGLLLRRRERMSPVALAAFHLAVSGPLSWLASYPDASIGFIQGLVALLPVAYLVSRCREKVIGEESHGVARGELCSQA